MVRPKACALYEPRNVVKSSTEGANLQRDIVIEVHGSVGPNVDYDVSNFASQLKTAFLSNRVDNIAGRGSPVPDFRNTDHYRNREK